MKYTIVLLLMMTQTLLLGCMPAQTLVSSGAPVALTVRQGDVSLSVMPPDGWRGFLDGTHLILTNQREDAPAENNIVINLWMPAAELVDTPADDSGLRTAQILQQITRSPQMIGNAIASTPQPFQWLHYDGAYYVLNSGSDPATLVIALTPRDMPQMIVINITGSEKALNRLQSTVGAALDAVLVNDHRLSHELLTLLPQPLELPTPEGMMTRP